MKKVIQIVLVFVIVGLAYILYRQFATPLEFQKIEKQRSADVINRLKDIRSAQRAYKIVFWQFTPSMDSLIKFVKNDSLTYERAIGSMDDSLAVAKGKVSRVAFKVAVRDTIFSGRNLTDADIENFRYIPHSANEEYPKGQEFLMDAGNLQTGSGVIVPVLEVRAPFKAFLNMEGYEQELVNLIDKEKSFGKYPGWKVGSMDEATNEGGNWE